MPQLLGGFNAELRQRIARLESLLEKVSEVPDEWKQEAAAGGGREEKDRINPAPCRSWDDLVAAWSSAQRWRRSLSDMLATALAVAASTSQTGNQLHLLLIAPAGSMKTVICDAMLVTKKCIIVEGITGFVSGAKSEDGRDLSFLARANHLTWVTPEGDVMVKSPLFAEIMAQARRIFDGSYSQVYKTTDEDLNFFGLRTPWVIAGTPMIIDYWEQSGLGDRFLRFWLDEPTDDERRKIVLAAMDSEWHAVTEHSNGSSGGIEHKLRNAYAMTGGYIEWLRDNVAKINKVTMSEYYRHLIADFAEFAADMRAKPNNDPRRTDSHDTKELPTRIGRQLVRLARCYAFVLNKWAVDAEVMRMVADRAIDTSKGKTLDTLRWFYMVDSRSGRQYQQAGGIMSSTLSRWAGYASEPKLIEYMQFLQKIGVIEHVGSSHSSGHWKVCGRVDRMYRNIFGV